MGFIELFFLSIGLAMDAFAVAICKGTTVKNKIFHSAVLVGLWFGFFQALMPFFGYLLGITFKNFVVLIDHWIAFFLLLFLGINMSYEAFSNDKELNKVSVDFSFKEMFMLAVATSIDALAVGITFSFFEINIFSTILLIGSISFVLSFIGVFIGKSFENKFQKKAEIFGGIVLIGIAFKILLEHLGII